MEKNNYWTTVFQKRISRRKALSAALGTGLGYVGLSALGCSSGRGPASTTPPTPLAKLEAPTGQAKTGGTFKYIGYEPVHWDPNQTSSGWANMNFSRVYAPLTTMRHGPQFERGDFTVEPWVAEKWEQPDPTTYVFHLRQGIKFHDVAPVNGRELTSEDVKYTIARVSDKQTGNPELRYRVEDIVSVETPDKYTVKIKLGQPVASFLMFTAGTPFLITPHETIEKYGDLKTPESAIGAGPWMLDKFEPKVRVSYKKHPEFFIKGRPYLDSLDTIIMSDPASRVSALRTGSIDATPVGRTDYESLKQTNPDLVYDEFWGASYARITFRLDKPPFNDVRVRRAVAMALDFDGFIKSNLQGAGQRVGPMTPALGKLFLPYEEGGESSKWYNHSPEQAKQLLAEAGYPNGFETTMNGTTYYGPSSVETMELAAAYLEKIGIKAKIDLKEYAAYMSTTFVGKFEGMAGPITTHVYADPDYYLWSFFYPGSPANHGNLNDAELNKMLEKMKQEFNAAERIKVVHDIQKRIRDQVYNIAMPSAPGIYAMQPYVKNYVSMYRVLCVGNWGKETLEVWLDN